MKVAISTCPRGFNLSEEALRELKLSGVKNPHKYNYNNKRTDMRLIMVIQKLGKEASSCKDPILLVEVPDEVKDWYIVKNGGTESIHEGRVWRSVFPGNCTQTCASIEEIVPWMFQKKNFPTAPDIET